jgi:hypothetical protein
MVNGVSPHDGRTVESAPGEANGVDAPTRQRIGSIMSNGECSYYAPTVLSGTTTLRTPTEESSAASSGGGYFDRRELSPTFSASPRDAPAGAFPLRRDPPYLNGGGGGPPRNDGPLPPRHLPSLSDMFDVRALPSSSVAYPNEQQQPPYQPNSNIAMLPRGYQTASPAPTAGSVPVGEQSRPPSLRHEQSSAGSMSSGSSYSSYPRTPVEGPLPVHALLTNAKQFGDSGYAKNATMYRSMSPDDRAATAAQQCLPDRAPSETVQAAQPIVQHSNGEIH